MPDILGGALQGGSQGFQQGLTYAQNERRLNQSAANPMLLEALRQKNRIDLAERKAKLKKGGRRGKAQKTSIWDYA